MPSRTKLSEGLDPTGHTIYPELIEPWSSTKERTSSNLWDGQCRNVPLGTFGMADAFERVVHYHSLVLLCYLCVSALLSLSGPNDKGAKKQVSKIREFRSINSTC